MNKIKIGLIGYGTVGKAFYTQSKQLTEVDVTHIGVRQKKKSRDDLHDVKITHHAIEICRNPEVDIVVEAIDNSVDALEYAWASIKAGKIYITANKKMVAENLQKLVELQNASGGKLFLEACVAGAIPILGCLQNHFRHEPIHSIRGIVNGSCNYILSRIRETGHSFDQCLKEAQELGFAETDYSSDVDGHDAVYKSCILTYLAFGTFVHPDFVDRKGIGHISNIDVELARERKLRIKSLVHIEKEEGELKISVRPELIKAEDPLYHVEFEQNALTIVGKHSGPISIQGAGAGGHPTASAMIADLGQAVKSLKLAYGLAG